MARPSIVIALPPEEEGPIAVALRDAGFHPLVAGSPAELERLLAARRDIGVAILDGEGDLDTTLELYSLLHEAGRSIPSLIMLSPKALEQFSNRTTGLEDEYLTRPYTIDSIRWRVEAMCIRAQTVDDGSGPVIQSGPIEVGEWVRRAPIIATFNPKGGVGKTTIATNLAFALVAHKGQEVMLVDADTVTGHVVTSLGLEQVRTVMDSWQDEREGGPPETFAEIATQHPCGLKVLSLTTNPIDTELLEPRRVAEALTVARRGLDYIVVDLHPSYSAINQAVFERADRILVPVTPDIPAIRAAVQLRDVALELGLAEKLAMVVNRANSGVSVADMEKTVGMPALAQIRSGGMLLVHAANEGRTVIDKFPRERISEDFDALADRVMGTPSSAAPSSDRSRTLLGLFGRREPIRA